MAGYVGELNSGETLPASAWFAGAWKEFRRTSHSAGDRFRIEGDGAEHAVIVLAGLGTARAEDQVFQLDEGATVTIGLNAVVEFEVDSGLELFITTLRVDA